MEEVERQRIERRAEELLERVPAWIWDGESLPVPIDDIADSCCGLLVCSVEEMQSAPGCPPLAAGQSLSGLLLPDRAEIWVDATEAQRWPPRRRFTVAHEIGHWILHGCGGEAVFCRHGQVDPDPDPSDGAALAPGGRPPLEPIEEEANHFAAALLMPARLVRREYERSGGEFAYLRDAFSSSGAAMGRRLHQVI